MSQQPTATPNSKTTTPKTRFMGSPHCDRASSSVPGDHQVETTPPRPPELQAMLPSLRTQKLQRLQIDCPKAAHHSPPLLQDAASYPLLPQSPTFSLLFLQTD
jgi:hypothetical protein